MQILSGKKEARETDKANKTMSRRLDILIITRTTGFDSVVLKYRCRTKQIYFDSRRRNRLCLPSQGGVEGGKMCSI